MLMILDGASLRGLRCLSTVLIVLDTSWVVVVVCLNRPKAPLRASLGVWGGRGGRGDKVPTHQEAQEGWRIFFRSNKVDGVRGVVVVVDMT